MAMLRGFVLVILARDCESLLFLQSDRYENNDCTGQLLRTEYTPPYKCQPLGGGSSFGSIMYSCSGGNNFTVTYYSDSACTTVFDSVTPEETCDTSNGRKYSCTAITAVATTQFFSTEDCSAANLIRTEMSPSECHPLGYTSAWWGSGYAQVSEV